MPPWLDSPEEVGIAIGALFGVLGAVGVGAVGLVAAVVSAWRSKVKPLLVGTQRSAAVAAFELRNNHGSSTRDAVDRIERSTRDLRADIRDMRRELVEDRSAGNRAHSEIFRRLHSLESPPEDTGPRKDFR